MGEDIVADDLLGRGAIRRPRTRNQPRRRAPDQQAATRPATRPASSRPPARPSTVPPRCCCDRGARNHRDVLGAQPIGRADLNAHHRPLGIGQSELRLAVQIVALGGGERGARLVALAVVDDAELIPGEGIVVVARDGDPKHALGFLEIGRILGRDEGVAEQGGDQRLIGRRSRPPRAAPPAPRADGPDSSSTWPFSSRK